MNEVPRHGPVRTALLSFLRFFLLCCLVHPVVAQTGRPAYPEARRTGQVDRYHGVDVADPYRWMEDVDAPETQAWLAAQEALTRQTLQGVPGYEAIGKRLESFVRIERFSLPVAAGEHYLFMQTEATTGAGLLLYAQDGPDAAPRVLLDPRRAFGPDARLGAYWTTRDGRFVAFAVARGTSRWRQIRLVDTATGALLPDAIDGLHTSSWGFAWVPDGHGFYYVRPAVPPGAPLPDDPPRPVVYFHRLGTAQADDVVVYERPDRAAWGYGVSVTSDGDYLVVTAREGSDPRNHVFVRDLRTPGSPVVPLREADAAYTFLGSEGRTFWFYTDHDAPLGRIVAVDLDAPARLETVVAETDEAMAGGSLVGGNGVAYLGGRFVVLYARQGAPEIRVFERDGRRSHTVTLPAGSAVWSGFSGWPDADEMLFQVSNAVEPGTSYRLDLRSGERKLFRRTTIAGFDPSAYVTERVAYRSDDGTRVPMLLVRRADLRRDGTAPVMLYAYGAFKWTALPWYQPHVVAWLEQGGIFALAGIRGGGEYGEAWHRAGMGVNRQNAIDDVAAAAAWLVAEGYTTPGRLVANGGSASAATVAAAVLQHPDRFGAAVIDRPALDMIRFEQFTTARSWIQEFGSPRDPDAFRVLHAYSPYHNVEPGRCYPPTLVMVGEHDEITVPSHGYKSIAALQAAQACPNPILLKLMRGAAHNFGQTPAQVIDAFTDELAFLFYTLGLTYEPVAPEATSSSR